MDKIDEMFSGMGDFYPGSKNKRRAVDPNAKPRVVKDKESWDLNPQVKKLPNGNVVELYSAGSLCLALGRPIVTVRLWERKGYIPRAPYRLKSVVVAGVNKPGWRMYSKAMIIAAAESFESRGLIEAPRIDWNRHPALSIELTEKWKKIHDQETAPKTT
jgi:hypothetical protein